MKHHAVIALLLAALLSVASPAMAQDDGSGWYAGVGAGRANADFRPYYTYYTGGTPDQFENEAHGLQIEFMAGRRHQMSRRWSLALEAHAAVNSFEWSLSIPSEPAELEYSLPYRFALSVVPEMHFGKLTVYAGVGGGMGRVHELKTTTDVSNSRYDYDEIRPTFNLGGGVRVNASRGLGVFAHVGYARYFGVEFDTFSGSVGSVPVKQIEHVTDKPRSTAFTVGITKRF